MNVSTNFIGNWTKPTMSSQGKKKKRLWEPNVLAIKSVVVDMFHNNYWSTTNLRTYKNYKNTQTRILQCWMLKKVQKKNGSLSRSTPKCYGSLFCVMFHLSIKFQDKRSSSFWLILLRGKQTNCNENITSLAQVTIPPRLLMCTMTTAEAEQTKFCRQIQ